MAASGNYIVESDIDNWDDAVSSTETFATTAVNITTDRITVANDIDTASLIRFSSTGAVPAPLVAGTAYYAINIDATTIEVATSAVNAAAGTAVDITDVGSGTHTLDTGEGSGTTDRQEIINRVEQTIELITKDYFYSKAFVIYIDGNSNDRLFLGLIPDVLTVTEIKISGVELPDSWWTSDVNSVYLDPEAVTGDEDDLPELYLRLSYKHRLFPKGMGNIKVTGTYGWSSTPPAIKQAAIILASSENDSTLYPGYSSTLKSEKIGDYAYTLADIDMKSSTGIESADKLLRNYIRKKPMLSTV